MLAWLIASALSMTQSFFDAPDSRLAYSLENTNGNGITGDLYVRADGSFDHDGDIGGTSWNDSWWNPEGTGIPDGTWHARLEYVSGNAFFNQSGFDPKDTWIDVSTEIRWRFYKSTWGSGGGSGDGVYYVKWSNDGGSTTHHTCTVTVRLAESSL